MATYYDEHADLAAVQGRRCAVLGDGSDAIVHAAALRDAGVDVRIGAAPDAVVHDLADAAGLVVEGLSELASRVDLVVLVDTSQASLDRFAAEVTPMLGDGAAVLVLDPVLLRFGLLDLPPQADVVLVQPLAPAAVLERELAAGRGVPVLVAVHRDVSGDALELALSYAKAIGGTRAGAIGATVESAAETAIFGEYAVAGAAVEGLVAAGFETLVEAGYPRDLAYLACVHSLQRAASRYATDGGQIEPGPGSIDEYARRTGGARVIDGHVRETLRRALRDVQSGAVADDYVADRTAGGHRLERLRTVARRHPISATGRRVRRLLPWLGTSAGDARHAR